MLYAYIADVSLILFLAVKLVEKNLVNENKRVKKIKPINAMETHPET